jgi:hypothetical protein
VIAPNVGTLTRTTAGVYKVFLLPSYRQRAMPRRHGVNFVGLARARSSRRQPRAHRCVTVVDRLLHRFIRLRPADTTTAPPPRAPTVRFPYQYYNRKGRTSAYARASSLPSDWILCRISQPSRASRRQRHPHSLPIG